MWRVFEKKKKQLSGFIVMLELVTATGKIRFVIYLF